MESLSVLRRNDRSLGASHSLNVLGELFSDESLARPNVRVNRRPRGGASAAGERGSCPDFVDRLDNDT